MPAFLISKGYTTTTTLYEKFPNKQIAWFWNVPIIVCWATYLSTMYIL